MNTRMTLLLLSFCLTISTAQVTPAATVAFPVVERGQALVEVVAEDDPAVQAAVRDLQHYVREMTGAELAIHTGQEDRSGPTLHVGATELYDDIAELREGIVVDGFAMASVGDDFIVAGNHPRGTSNGIMTLLQQQFRVRWYYADPLFEIVPEREDLTITMEPGTTGAASGVVVNPDYIERTIWGGPPNNDYGRRMRLTHKDTPRPLVGAGHSLSRVVPSGKYFDEHPDYFALKDGERNTDHPCFTHPDMPEIFMEYIREGGISLGVNDNVTVCHCERCMEVDGDSEPYQGMDNVSESYCQLVQKVAAQTAEEMPGHRLGIFAYQITNAPPKTVDHLGENVDVVLCQDTSQYFDPEYKRIDNEMAKEWVEKSGYVRMYDYFGIDYWTPRYFPTILAEQLSYLHDIGVAGYSSHFTTSIASSMPMFYLYNQMMWESDVDHEALIETMLEDLYVEAAGPMKEFYQLWEDRWESQTKSKWFFGMDDFGGEMTIYRREDFARGRELLDEARAIAKKSSSQKVIDRLDYINKRHELTEAAAAAYYAAQDAIHSEASTPDEAMELSNNVVHAWDHFTKILSRNKDLPAGYASHWFSKTFRVRAWGLKQMMRDASQAPLVRWSADHETTVGSKMLQDAEAEFAAILERNRQHIEALLTEEIDAAERKPRADGVRVAAVPYVDLAPAEFVRAKKWSEIEAIEASDWVFRARPEDPDIEQYDEPLVQFYVDPPAEADQSQQWQAAWNDDYLYLRVMVRDDVHQQGQPAEAMWKEDSVQIALNPDRTNFVYPQHSWLYMWGGYLGAELEFGVSLKDDQAQVAVWHTPEELNIPGPEKRIQARARRVGDRTFYEAAVPWRLLPGFNPDNQRSLGVGLVVNDVDGGPRRSAEYGSGIVHAKRPTEFAAIRLKK